MDSSWFGNIAIGILVWWFKYSYTKEQKAQEDNIKELQRKVDSIEVNMPTKKEVEKLSDDNRKGHVDIYEKMNKLRENLANLKGRMGQNGN